MSQLPTQPPPPPTPSPHDVNNSNQTSLFGLQRPSGRRQSMSRVYQVTTPVSYGLDDDSDDDGIITVDPITHQTSIMRPTGTNDLLSKEALDRLDGRGSRYSVHRASISLQGSGSYPNLSEKFGNNAGNAAHNQFSSPHPSSPSQNPATSPAPTGTPPPPPLNLEESLVLPELPDQIGSETRFHRRPSLAVRSPSVARSESVMRVSTKSVGPGGSSVSSADHTAPMATSPTSPDGDPTSPTIHHLPAGIPLDHYETSPQDNIKDLQQQQQNLLSELNYHFPYATPSAPPTAMQQTHVPGPTPTSIFPQNISNQGVNGFETNTFTTPLDDLYCSNAITSALYYNNSTPGTSSSPPTISTSTKPSQLTQQSQNQPTNYCIGGRQIVSKSPLHGTVLSTHSYETEDSYNSDDVELDELQSILQATTLASSILPSQLDHLLSNNDNTNALTDREQFKLSSYSTMQQQHYYTSTQSNSQLPSKHAYSSIFIPSIYPLHPPTHYMLSTANTGLLNTNTAATAPQSTSESTSVTKQRYTWKGSHHRHALKKRRVQILRFALNEEYKELEPPQGQNANGELLVGDASGNAGGDLSDDDVDESLLYTQYSNTLVTKQSTTNQTTQSNATGMNGVNLQHATGGRSQGDPSTPSTPRNGDPNVGAFSQPSGIGSTVGGTGSPIGNVTKLQEVSESEFLFQQKNARKHMARAIVPSPNEIVLVEEGTGAQQVDVMTKKNKPEEVTGPPIDYHTSPLPLPYSASGVTTLDYLSRHLDNRGTKDIMKGRKHLATLTAAYQEDQASVSTAQGNGSISENNPDGAAKPSLFNINKNKKLHDDMSGSISAMGSQNASNNAHQITSLAPAPTNLAYTTPLKPVIVNNFTDQEKQQAIQHLYGVQQYEELCKRRMRQGCFVYKYKQFQPTKRFLYLSHNDTMLSWRELTSKEEKKFALWDSMPEDWKECAVLNEMATSGIAGDDFDELESASPATTSSTISRSQSLSKEKEDRGDKKSSRWSSFFSGGTPFKSTKNIPIDEIKQIFYGPFVGLGFGQFVEQCKRSNAKPWYATTMQTQTETLNFVFLCNYDVTLWLQGLNMLAPSTGKAFTLGKMLWLRVIMKINFVGYNDFVFGSTGQNQQLTQEHDEFLGGTVTTANGTVHVADLNPNITQTQISQTATSGLLLDWSNKVSLPGSNDLSKYK